MLFLELMSQLHDMKYLLKNRFLEKLIGNHRK